MTDGPLQFTMRELRRTLRAPRFWLAITGAALLLGLVGPFGTYDGLTLPVRLAYWAVTVLATYLTGLFCVFLLAYLTSPASPLGMTRLGFAGAVAGVPVAAIVWLINWVVFAWPDGAAIGFVPLVFYCIVISGLVSVLIAVFSRDYEMARAASGAAGVPQRPRILDRLPPAKRGRLRHLSVQDHYVDVRTDRGGALLLMRLQDAVAETEGVEGLRIHRSHWVASDAVAEAVRRDGRLFLRLDDGTELPVSRSYVSDVREAGLA
ncbi:LytTR family transcriptional regulator [Nitratireductor mangrovi]|uniref:LytTR family transcriptional regulator n=1 Tax=Nitratireductor mangrovi TaxID=2599600 RepID=A0A5B8KYW0_9HYPH|nr:LytTR family DNA-binding domain-containing protein [Nitratireductor mangrovi]QDZ00736.1 LytTR family transcriptional regulator [Nitratireductor mangrovi]